MIDPNTSNLLLGGLLATLLFLFVGALVVFGLGAWFRSWLSGFDGLQAKREGGKLRFEGVIVDKARPAREAVRKRSKPRAKATQAPDVPVVISGVRRDVS